MVVDTDDVRRARERADLLARAGIATLAVAAGKAATDLARRRARDNGVWVSPTADLMPSRY
ncbi:MAG TPA: hypothetical protein VMM13_06440 [Euzebya sp.]|nr:hypothetical protein [Euzebya sp.]